MCVSVCFDIDCVRYFFFLHFFFCYNVICVNCDVCGCVHVQYEYNITLYNLIISK